MKTSITFNPPSQLPDADQDVLASILREDGSIEVWEAHYEDGAWLTSNATLIQPPCEVVSWADKPEGVDLRNGTACNQIMASQAETKLRDALQALLASEPVIAEATADELQAAIDDPDAEEIVKVQAAAVLNARQALAATEQAAPAVPQGLPAFDELDDEVIDAACTLGSLYRVDLMRAYECIRAMLAAPLQEPVTCGNGCSCLVQCGDTYAHAGLPIPKEPVTLTADEIDANTVWFDPDPHDNVHCDVHATVNKCIAALREKQAKVTP